ncbi:MAG: hypothetical protein U0800_03375 [Isosphaeraceae bacterium]
MPKVPSLQKLLENYPDGKLDGAAVAVLVGGVVRKNFEDEKFTAYKNTCAIRVSRALNYGGKPIAWAGGGLANPYMDDKKIRTHAGDDKKAYIYGVYDLPGLPRPQVRGPRNSREHHPGGAGQEGPPGDHRLRLLSCRHLEGRYLHAMQQRVRERRRSRRSWSIRRRSRTKVRAAARFTIGIGPPPIRPPCESASADATIRERVEEMP